MYGNWKKSWEHYWSCLKIMGTPPMPCEHSLVNWNLKINPYLAGAYVNLGAKYEARGVAHQHPGQNVLARSGP